MAAFFVCILASRYRGTMYIGVTNNLSRRVSEYKSGAVPGFTKQYGITRLVYCETYSSILEARERERVQKNGVANGNSISLKLRIQLGTI